LPLNKDELSIQWASVGIAPKNSLSPESIMKEKREILMKPLLLFLCLCLFIPIIQAQDTICTPALSFAYDANNDIFSLMNSDGTVLQSYTEIRDYYFLSHSPDCRFIVASLWRDYHGSERPDISIAGDTTVWNAGTGEQLQAFEDAHESPHSIIWSPDSERLIVSTRHGQFLWNFYTDTKVQITSLDGWWLELYWDTSRTEVFILPYTLFLSSGEVRAYNWLSGEYLATYTSYLNRDNYTTSESGFAVRGDWVIVGMYAFTTNNTPITIWDRNTGELIAQLNGGSVGIIPIYEPAGDEQQVALSPDRRYFAVADWTLKVWDMSNLAENYEDRRPAYQYHLDVDTANAVRFIDNTTVEILLDDNITLIRMNILTGEILE
jgi:WD40 repeat protein